MFAWKTFPRSVGVLMVYAVHTAIQLQATTNPCDSLSRNRELAVGPWPPSVEIAFRWGSPSVEIIFPFSRNWFCIVEGMFACPVCPSAKPLLWAESSLAKGGDNTISTNMTSMNVIYKRY